MDYKSPFNIYVVWHPDFMEGKSYADKIYNCFNRDTEFALERNLNIPVFYRSVPFGDSKVPIEIPFNEADRNAIILLIDQNIINDDWENYVSKEILRKISSNSQNRIFPISLYKDSGVFLEDELSRLQAIRAIGIKNSDPTIQFDERWTLIRSKLLHDFARLMYNVDSVATIEQLEEGSGFKAKPTPKISFFISHAKADGLTLAKTLRDYIQSETQLDTFFDANDIADSYKFDDQIIEQFNDKTAVIVVLSDKYATREWCRKELSTAKRNKCPIVIINQLQKGEIRSFPYIGNVPSIVGEKNIQNLIDLTLIQVLNSRFSKIYLEKHLKMYGLNTVYQCLTFANPPELFNHLDIKTLDAKDDKQALLIYPDPPLGIEEQSILTEILPEVIFTTPSHSFQYI